MASASAFRQRAGICRAVDFSCQPGHMPSRESGGRCTRQLGQGRKAAATTNSYRVVPAPTPLFEEVFRQQSQLLGLAVVRAEPRRSEQPEPPLQALDFSFVRSASSSCPQLA